MDLKPVQSSYSEQTHWQKYQQFFPRELQYQEGTVEEFNWEWRGYSIHVDRISGHREGKLVIVLHGGGGYGRFLYPLAKSINSAGYQTLCPDLPGFGLTKPRKSSFTYDDWVQLISDMVDKLESEGKEIALFGLSLGGMLAYHVAAKNPNVKAVIATTLADAREIDVQKAMVKYGWSTNLTPLAKRLPEFLQSIRLPMAHFANLNCMSKSDALNKLVSSDSLGGGNWVPISFFTSLTNFGPAKEPETFSVPVLLAHPRDDFWTPVELSHRFFDRLAGEKELVLLENCGHAPIEEPGLSTLRANVNRFLDSYL